MGARGKLAEITSSLPLKLSEAHRYRLGILAARRGGSMASTIRWLIDQEWDRHERDAFERLEG